MTLTPLDVAEDAFAYTPDPPTWERVELDGYVLRNNAANPHPMFGEVLRPRLGGHDLDAVLAEVRSWFRTRGRERYTWLIGDSASPAGLVTRLRERGLEPDADEPVYAGMILDREPPGVPGVETHATRDADEAVGAIELAWRSFDAPPADEDTARARIRETWEAGGTDWALGRGSASQDTGARRPGGEDVAPDPRAPRVPAGADDPRARRLGVVIDVVDVAENAFGLLPVLPPATRESSDELILLDQDGPTDRRMALRMRFPLDELDARREAVRAWSASAAATTSRGGPAPPDSRPSRRRSNASARSGRKRSASTGVARSSPTSAASRPGELQR